jgi:1-acyl-sn-glycerol-3-phosphate acyltransferase
VTIPPFHWWKTVFVLIPTIGFYTVALGIVSLIGVLFDGRGHFAHRCAQWWSRLIMWTSRTRIERVGALPPDGQSCVFVANHASFYDVPVLFTALPTQLRIMAKATLGYVPFIGWHLARSGHVFVQRVNPGAGIFKKMQKMARSGASLIVFPEAARTEDGELQAFKAGIFLLAIEHGLPVVPVTVAGTREVMPKGRLRVEPATVRVTVHPPIPTAGMSRREARGLAERARTIVQSGLDAATP